MEDIDNIFNSEAFENIEPERKKALRQLYFSLKGKSMEKALPIIMTFKMPKGKNISQQERNAMINTVLMGLNENDRKNMESVLKIIGF